MASHYISVHLHFSLKDQPPALHLLLQLFGWVHSFTLPFTSSLFLKGQSSSALLLPLQSSLELGKWFCFVSYFPCVINEQPPSPVCVRFNSPGRYIASLYTSFPLLFFQPFFFPIRHLLWRAHGEVLFPTPPVL